MIIGICGIGATGSGAVEDLLKEYDDVQNVYEDEFNIIYTPDGLLDLEYHLVLQPNRFFSSDIAIKRFIAYTKKIHKEPHGYYNKWTKYKFGPITKKYIESIIQMKWKGFWYFDLYECSNILRTLKFRILDSKIITPLQLKLRKKIITINDRNMYLSIVPDNFYAKTREYLYELFDSMGVDYKSKVCVSQLFPGNNPTAGMQFFDNVKAIVVERDPRDLYVLQKLGKCVLDHWAPTKNVHDFVNYYRYCRNYKKIKDPRVLYIQFEDLIYKYENTVKNIENFLEIKHHSQIKKYFNPDVSINNTQLYVGLNELSDEIKYIENELSEYLYDFSGIEKKVSTINIAF